MKKASSAISLAPIQPSTPIGLNVLNSLSPDESRSAFQRGIRGRKNEQSPALANALGQLKEFMTESQKAHYLLREGKIASERGDYIGAIECFGHSLSFQPNIVPPYLFRAVCYKNLNMFSEAYFDYSFAIRLEPENGSHYCSRASTLAKMKKYGLAIEDADRAVEVTSQRFFSFFFIYYFFRS